MSDNTQENIFEHIPNSEPDVATVSRRDRIRGAVFGAKPKSEVFTFFGEQVEIRQPSLGIILEQRQASSDEQTFNMLLNYTFVPGTVEKVFEQADIDALRNVPFGEDMNNFTTKMQKLLGLSATDVNKEVDEAKNS